MQGLNPSTMQCIYSTPCGWCTKWDKKCDKKIGRGNDKPKRDLRAEIESLLDEPILTPQCIAMLNGERYDDTLKIHFEGEDDK